MRARVVLDLMVVSLSTFAGSGISHAQEAVPETPPELRDFRLDPERPAPRTEPATESPVVTPPPVVATQPPATAVRPSPTVRAAPVRRPQVANTPVPQPAPEQSVPVAATVAPPTSAMSPEPELSDVSPATPVAVTDTQTPSTGFTIWQILAALVAGAGLSLGAVYFFRRRRVEADTAEPEVFAAPSRPVAPKPAPAAPIPSKPVDRPQIVLDFVPEKATISFASLTVKGQLRLINDASGSVQDMQLRTTLMSASARQEQAIESFNSESEAVTPAILGEAKAGERLAMAIELTMPLSELESFTIGKKRLAVPIMVANLQYRSEKTGGVEIAQLACLIGREAQPPKSKMGPLRLELGPRSFVGLGQRPIFN
ncbi:MAG: LPXTG cell wall anchor domain-containing protein [Sphingorhabdus sp.]